MEEENLSFLSFIRIVFKRLWVIILITLIAVSTSAYVSYFVLTPIYQTKVDLLISGNQDPENPNLNASVDEALKLLTTYQDIIQSPLILQKSQSKLNEKGHHISIGGGNISVKQKTGSQVLEIFVVYEDPNEAALIADAIAESFSEQIQDLMEIKRSNVKIMNKATVNPYPVSPKPYLIMGITFVVALIVSMWLILLIHYLRKRREVSKSKRLEKS